MRQIANIALWCVNVCALAVVLAWFVLQYGICDNPRVLDAATGHTFPHHCHGTTVFITPIEHYLLYGLIPGFFLLALAHFALRVKYKI